MPELSIHLLVDPATGKKNIVIEYEADSDALPHEHEEEHRALLEKLIEGGIVKAEEIGKVSVARENSRPISEAQTEPAVDEREPIKQGPGSA